MKYAVASFFALEGFFAAAAPLSDKNHRLAVASTRKPFLEPSGQPCYSTPEIKIVVSEECLGTLKFCKQFDWSRPGLEFANETECLGSRQPAPARTPAPSGEKPFLRPSGKPCSLPLALSGVASEECLGTREYCKQFGGPRVRLEYKSERACLESREPDPDEKPSTLWGPKLSWLEGDPFGDCHLNLELSQSEECLGTELWCAQFDRKDKDQDFKSAEQCLGTREPNPKLAQGKPNNRPFAQDKPPIREKPSTTNGRPTQAPPVATNKPPKGGVDKLIFTD
ncbi:hypothetical protein AAL_05566 [Moelleriella libera RCEF 2490]|uniref:Uncharacterized protein n=1 Tax=Moelleriella libera RCEF 2490 TaxID=1081109 RepID=A0A166P1B8_9HYPO|nr:hypothetical protein AAL_05566 [Moelleriella libera RCEF 2490]